MPLLAPHRVVKLISYWPPYLASGIRVLSADPEMTKIEVELRTRFWNKNYVGTHFGGSLFSMCDPFYMFMLLHHLRDEHIVWDLASTIRFVKARSEPVRATFEINQQDIAAIRQQALEQFKVEPIFNTQVLSRDGEVVAEVSKTLYVRRKDAKERFKS